MIAVLCACASQNENGIPQTEIQNEEIKVKLYLPDAQSGYYRATRFDWSGVIFQLEYKGHNYVDEWFDKYDPLLHDAICGPVDEFVKIGYDDAPVGGEFLKIGVGILKKASGEDYSSFGLYDIVNGGKWSIKQKENQVSFTQTLKSDNYNYIYTKTVTLTPGKPELVLDYSLKNTGKNTLETEVYNHNFFTMDNQVTGPDCVVRFPFEPTGQLQDKDSLAIISGNEITYREAFGKGYSVFMGNVYGFTDKVEDNSFEIINKKTSAGVRYWGSRPLSRMVFWACQTVSCPEPYIQISVKPGETFQWKNRYEFYVGK